MAEFLKSWIITVTAAATITAIAAAIIPGGAVKKASGLALGLVLMLAVLSPIKRLDVEYVGRLTEDFMSELGQEAEFSEENEQMEEIIASEIEAYILDKAHQMGTWADVEQIGFEYRRSIPVPVDIHLRGEPLEELADVIEQELGIGKDSQIWN